MASARAGNVIGGGDWATDRLVPDIFKSVQNNEPVELRNPKAVRPWQHVLEPLSGYLLLGQHALESNTIVSDAWNFGPNDNVKLSVEKVVLAAKSIWNSFDYEVVCDDKYHEAKLLNLDSSKAKKNLGWQSILDAELSIKMTMNWYREFHLNQKILTASDINFYMDMINARNR